MMSILERLIAEERRRLLLVSVFSWLFVIGGVGARGATDSTLRVNPEAYDFGAVKRLGGQVHTSFAVHNQGETSIKIRRIWTS